MPRNDGHRYDETIGPAAHGRSLLDHLAASHPHGTRETWLARVERGEVRLDGSRPDAHAVLARGQRLSWDRPPWDEPDAPCRYDLLHLDDTILAVDKPPGLPVLPGAGFLQSTLLHLVRRDHPDAAPVHRLGRWTSGVVLFARTPAARAALSAQWAERSVVKIYRGLAAGRIAAERLDIDTPIGRVPHARLGTVHAARDDGKPASTRLRVLRRAGDATLAELRIETGRPHQIRIHLAAIGHPLVGDPLYPAGGVPPADATALPGDPGYLLHACELRFRHPVDGTPVRVASEPPAALSG